MHTYSSMLPTGAHEIVREQDLPTEKVIINLDDTDTEILSAIPVVSRNMSVHKYRYRTAAAVVSLVLVVGVIGTLRFAKARVPEAGTVQSSETLLGEECASTYGGSAHPTGKACCAKACGKFCGAVDCENGPGGPSKCCESVFSDTCGVDGAKAPCKFPLGSPTTFTGIMGVTNDNPKVFAESIASRDAVKSALSVALNAPDLDIYITGIAAGSIAGGRRLSKVALSTVGYTITAPPASTLTAKLIAAAHSKMPTILNGALEIAKVKVHVTAVSMQEPVAAKQKKKP